MIVKVDENIDLDRIERFTVNYNGDNCKLLIESRMGNVEVQGNYTEILALENFIFQLHKAQRDKEHR